ncbi:hypothetical protein [Halococcus saccharolyticus]|uniref:Glycoside hydrolase domain protein n=1 Tax=Halococcus saccharolyticus DSM 5350 TaxID=1227455 RepID=M0MJ07_9EURY|nr:hypothetical protein [Halococcus saccharolyticus]EMA44714.1 hypothetical protein C449_08654 [Halococcus saccharolyticus DSM 5350]
MFGVVTRNAEELDWPTFDRRCYEVKSVSGQAREPIAAATSMISCHADTAAADASPELVPVTEDGEIATRERQYFDWGYVCPTHPDYREGLLETIADAADASGDVRLDDVGFPRPEYCFCDRCVEQFEESAYDDRFAWRASVVTEFVSEAADQVGGDLSLTLHPDPYPGHLHGRSGLDLDALSEYVDEFVVPLYDTAYGTTYWLESLASGFRDALDAPLAIELYAVDVDIENLVHAAEVADAYATDVLFGYDASNAQAAIRRLNAETREGKSYG